MYPDQYLHKHQARRVGNTTRAVDHAIQVLFKVGTLTIPLGIPKELKGLDPEADSVRSVVFDPAVALPTVSINKAQQLLYSRILKRLTFEHPNQWEEERIANGFKITLKNDRKETSR